VEKIMLSAVEHVLASGRGKACGNDPVNYIVYEELPEDPLEALELLRELTMTREMRTGTIAFLNPFTDELWELELNLHDNPTSPGNQTEAHIIRPKYKRLRGQVIWDNSDLAVWFWMKQCLSP
jgi:hypothetical protein